MTHCHPKLRSWPPRKYGILVVGPDEVNEDAETVKEKTAELTGKATEGAKDFGDQVRDKVKSD